MIQYLVILLDDTSTAYCQYANTKRESRLIPLDKLKAGIIWGMKENLMIQYILPDYKLPECYIEVMNSIDHHLIVSSLCEDPDALDASDVVIFNDWCKWDDWNFVPDKCYVVRTKLSDFFNQYSDLKTILKKVSRLSVAFVDEETFVDNDKDRYSAILSDLSTTVEEEYKKNHNVQFNLLTDRMMLDGMNNCGAGNTNITLAPDGKFYVCPAFYQAEDGYAIGSLADGLNIKNAQLYKLDHAPLCRNCDAYQCRRCIWLNRKTTLEVNTPSHEQCVVAHLERNASRKLLLEIRKHGTFLPDKEEISEINYLDPFDIRKEW